MDTRRKELGEFLQALRQRGTPEEFGFPAGNRRRTQGLRREEVAQLAGISTWYTWIEQGREVNVSSEALDRLAQALKLSRPERGYLFDMADRRDPRGNESEADSVPETLIGMLASITILLHHGPHLGCAGMEQACEALFPAGWTRSLQVGRRPICCDSYSRTQSQAIRGELGGACQKAGCRVSRRPSRPAGRSRSAKAGSELSQTSPEFELFWKQHDVLERQGGQREFNHPKKGNISFQQVTLRPVEQEQLKLVLLCQSDHRSNKKGSRGSLF